jgi:enterochelin esterase-like enzyme
MKRFLLVFVAATAVGRVPMVGAQAPCLSTVTGDLRIESFQSTVYGDRRTVRVWLPPGYNGTESAKKQYPVLYLFDGQTLFDNCTAFANERELQVDETVTRLIAEEKIPPMVIVGIDSSGRRQHEYRPYRDPLTDPSAPEPIGRELPGFLVNEVLPHVSKTYRVTADPTQTGIGGTSLGAIAALYVLLNHSDRFGIGLIESPTLPLGNGQLLRDTTSLARGPDRIYVGVGTTELAVPGGEKFAALLRTPIEVANAGFVKMSEALVANLKAAYINHPEVTFVVEPNGNHTSTSWARRFPRAVTALYVDRAR